MQRRYSGGRPGTGDRGWRLRRPPEPAAQDRPARDDAVPDVPAGGFADVAELNDATGTPWVAASDDDVSRLSRFLIDPGRRIPVLALSVPNDPPDDRGEAAPLLDAPALAAKAAGQALTVVLPRETSWELTNRFGKKLSVFDGAVRVYWPGFSGDADPFKHPLVLKDRILSIGAAEVTDRLLKRVAAGSGAPTWPGAQPGRISARPPGPAAAAPAPPAAAPGADGPSSDADREIKETRRQVSGLRNDLKAVKDELKALTVRVQELAARVEGDSAPADADHDLPDAWDQFAAWCKDRLDGRVVLTPAAKKLIKSARFTDVPQAARCLLWLATVYRDKRRAGGQGGDLRVSLEPGIWNEQCGGDSFTVKWQRRNTDVKWHIKNGGNTHAPERCLRIYYFWDDDSEQVVIPRMPIHRTTNAS